MDQQVSEPFCILVLLLECDGASRRSALVEHEWLSPQVSLRRRRCNAATGPYSSELARHSCRLFSVLVFGGPQSLAQLAQAEQVKPPTMSRIVNGLVEAGLATSTTDERDRRGIVIRPTEKGNRVMHAARQRRVETLARAVQGMSKREIGELRKAAALMESLRQKL